MGQPFCLDCYDYTGQVVWNAYVGELWRRTLIKVNKTLRAYGARASFAKVAEMQARGVVHLHALIRLDALLPELVTDTLPDGAQLARHVPGPPPPTAGLPQLRRVLEDAFTTMTVTTPPHPHRPGGWLVGWGEQLDVRTVRDPDLTRDPAGLTEEQVAGYLAKYATKATESTGHTSGRLTPQVVAEIIARRDHIAYLIDACWKLGHSSADTYAHQRTWKRTPERLRYARLRRWAHMLGFGGHFSTKSRRYSTTLGALRRARVDWRHGHRRGLCSEGPVKQTTLLIGEVAFAGIGWHTSGDALLAATAAAKAREHARNARDYADDGLTSPIFSTAA